MIRNNLALKKKEVTSTFTKLIKLQNKISHQEEFRRGSGLDDFKIRNKKQKLFSFPCSIDLFSAQS